MGKRSNFPRAERDFYPTPYAAVPPLIPHLDDVRSFAEPCCGDGSLVRHLESFGLRCVYQGDIATGQNALALSSYGKIDSIITNPPYRRPIMHALIWHFERIAPTWLLLELDWAATKQAIPFMASCSDIVTVGRLRLIEGTTMNGKQNFAWYRFDSHHEGGPVFHWHGSALVRRNQICLQCGAPHQATRLNARFCSNACRQRAYRERLNVTQV
jgi:hypothetical protein